MDLLLKSIVISAAVVVAAVTVAVEWWQYRNVPKTYSTHGQKARSD